MNIVLSPETQQLMEQRMKAGNYASVDEAVRTALGQCLVSRNAQRSAVFIPKIHRSASRRG